MRRAGGREEEAPEIYRRILELEASHLDARRRLAETLERGSLVNEACEQWLILAESLEKSGQVGEAVQVCRHVGEIDSENPGYKRIFIQPHTGGGLTSASARVNSMYGKVASAWSIRENKITLRVEVPPNTSAVVKLPGARAENVMESGKSLQAAGFSAPVQTDRYVSVNVGSGVYEFTYPL